MTDDHILTVLAVAARRNCYGDSALCACGDVTAAWNRVEPYLRNRLLSEEDKAYAARIIAGGEEEPWE